MKVLFAHDHRFLKKGNKLLSRVDFGMKMWERYLIEFEELVIAARISPTNEYIEESNYNVTTLNRMISTVDLASISNLKGLTFNYFSNYNLLKNEILKVDCVIARLPSEIGLLSIDIAKKLKKPYLVEMVGCPKDSYRFQGSFVGKIYSPLITYRTKLAIKNAPFVIYVTKDFLQNRYPNKHKNINCSNIDLSISNLNDNNEIALNRMSRINHNKKIIIGLNGSLNSKYKGVDTAIVSLKYLPKNYELSILGHGDTSPWKKIADVNNVSSQVNFEGSKAAGMPVYEWLDNIDIYLQPSKTEGLPRALIEAMSRGCPAIGTYAGGIPELLDNEFLVEIGDSVQLAEKIYDISNSHNKVFLTSLDNMEKSKEYDINILKSRRSHIFNQLKDTARMGL